MKRKPTAQVLLVYLLGALLMFNSFFGRGIYKYYFAGITPFALPFFTSKRNTIVFEAFSVILLLIPRIVNPWMGVLLITLLPSLVAERDPHQEISLRDPKNILRDDSSQNSKKEELNI